MIDKALEEKLDREGPPYLPMPHVVGSSRGKTRSNEAEWREYWLRWARHAVDGEYEKGFGRPTLETAEAVWQLLEPVGRGVLDVAGLVPARRWLSAEDKSRLAGVVKQVLVVALDTFVSAGLDKRMATQNRLFDALASRWSDHHRQSPARTVWDMSVERVKSCRRDLIVNGIDVLKFWEIAAGSWSQVKGGNPLYFVSRHKTSGYAVVPRPGSNHCERFEKLVRDDPSYVRSERRGLPLFLAGNKHAAYEAPCDTCGDIRYNVVSINEQSKEALRQQEEARLFFNLRAFRGDYDRAVQRAAEIRQKLDSQFRFNPALSNMTIPIRRSRTSRAGAPASRRPRGWSPRSQELIDRSIEEGFRIGWELDDEVLAARAAEMIRRNPEKWERRRNRWNNRQKNLSGSGPVASLEDVTRGYIVGLAWHREVARRLSQYDSANTHIMKYKQVNEQIKPFVVSLDDLLSEREPAAGRGQVRRYVKIRSGFVRIMNRRYQPVHFWPTFVTAKRASPEEEGDQGKTLEFVEESEKALTSHRRRWFKAVGAHGKIGELVGWDIASSQTQIVAALLGLEELQAQTAGASFKKILAEAAWSGEFGLRGYDNAQDARLQELVKNLWMRVLYGSRVKQVVMDQWHDRRTYGSGWTEEGAKRFLESRPGYSALAQFLKACRRLAEVAYKEDPYAGVTFTDPFDGVEVRWNPLKRRRKRVRSNGLELLVMAPAGHGRKRAIGSDVVVEYPVDDKRLGQLVAPCLVHMLDAYFSSLVMKKLAARGVRDFVGIHDCWLVPEDVRVAGKARSGRDVLREVMFEAASEWYEGLNPVYQRLWQYLQDDAEFGPFIRQIWQAWQKRKHRGDALTFRFRAESC